MARALSTGLLGPAILVPAILGLGLMGSGLRPLDTALSAPAQGSGVQASAAKADLPGQPPRTWAEAGAENQERIITAGEDVPLQYRVRKVDAHGDGTREVIESREGAVARLVERNGMPLTPAEDAAERDRLKEILSHPETLARHHRRERAGREYALELIRALPGAMLWSYTPGQPQLPEGHGTQVVLDFTPDPRFKPPSLVTAGLTGIAGRVWLDAGSRCVERIEGHIVHPVDFGWGGVLAKISQGGTVRLDQAQVAEHRWFYSHLSEHLTLREMLVHTVVENAESRAWDPQPLPAALSVKDAVHALLALQIQIR